MPDPESAREGRLFYVVSGEEIKAGKVVDVYFLRTMETLRHLGLEDTRVVAEIAARSLPRSRRGGRFEWGILAGVEEVVRLLEGRNVDLHALPDGSVFEPGLPVMRIEGPYSEFGPLETSLLGFLCSMSGVATAAAHVKVAAGGKPVVNFGIRRNHPAISLAIERAGLIGGLDGSSGILVEELGFKPVGTMPHALIIIAGDQVRAWRAFDEAVPEDVPRIALVDTLCDEKTEAIKAAEALGERLYGVRLDTPSSRRGKMEEIVREVRWELDLRGYKHVKIFVSGGLDEVSVESLSRAGADAFGVGSRICGADPVDFGMDVVEVEGEPRAKRGIRSGAKDVFRCPDCLRYFVLPKGSEPPTCPECGVRTEPAYVKFLEGGRLVADLPTTAELRERTLSQLRKMGLLPEG